MVCLGAVQEALRHEMVVSWVKEAEAVARVAPFVMAAPLEIMAQVEMA